MFSPSDFSFSLRRFSVCLRNLLNSSGCWDLRCFLIPVIINIVITMHLTASQCISIHFYTSQYISIHLNTFQYISKHLNTTQYISMHLNTSQYISKHLNAPFPTWCAAHRTLYSLATRTVETDCSLKIIIIYLKYIEYLWMEFTSFW